MEILFMLGAFGCASYSVAKGKNRRALLWFFIGLVTGPLAILAVALLPPAPGPDQGYN